MTIGPRRRSLPVLALALALAGCGSSRALTTAPAPGGAPPDGRVPAQARFLETTRGYPGHRPSLSYTTTNLHQIGKIATALDRLRVAHPGLVNCPNIPSAPTVTFTFRASRDGPVLARASTLASGPRGECPGVTFSARGHARQGLSAQPAFLREAQRLLGVTLMTK